MADTTLVIDDYRKFVNLRTLRLSIGLSDVRKMLDEQQGYECIGKHEIKPMQFLKK